MSYQITPKIALLGQRVSLICLQRQHAHVSSAIAQAFANYLTHQDTYSARAGLSYTVTPFIGASLNYTYSRMLQPGATVATTIGERTNQSSILFSVNYNPH